MMKNNMELHTKYTNIMLISLAVLLLGGSIAGYMVINSKKGTGFENVTTQHKQEPTAIPTRLPHPINGIMELREEKKAAAVPVGKPFVIQLVATSGNSKIAGYDVVMTYDKTALDRQAIQNGDATFRIFTFDRENRISISATKQLQSTEITQFEETPILFFTFFPKKKGKFTFSLKPFGQESSKFVDDMAQATYPRYKDLVLEIQ